MKRKQTEADAEAQSPVQPPKNSKTKTDAALPDIKPTSAQHLQIIAGTYDKVLHGIIASFPEQHELRAVAADSAVVFQTNFLFNAHESAIRCLAASPLPSADADTDSRRILLASGGSDGTIKVYQIETSIPPEPHTPSVNSHEQKKPSRNIELGSLTHHSSGVGVLEFASRTKLLSGSDDSTIAVSRTRDFTVLSSFKVPIPIAIGRPSGDTAPLGTGPSGVNDFSIHPSKKLMISVGKGEKCMRLWNLVTGKKAGVLAFNRDLLYAVGERRGARGEGLRVEWNASGDEFVVVFERGAAVFSMDCKPKCIFRPTPSTKLHRTRYLPATAGLGDVLVFGTEDGRLLLVNTGIRTATSGSEEAEPPHLEALGEIGGLAQGVVGRIKDFEFVRSSVKDQSTDLLIVTASSDGNIRLWSIELFNVGENHRADPAQAKQELPSSISGNTATAASPSVGVAGYVLGTFTTGSRITCLKAFLIYPTPTRPSNEHDSSHIASSAVNGISASHAPKEAPGEEFQGLDSDDD